MSSIRKSLFVSLVFAFAVLVLSLSASAGTLPAAQQQAQDMGPTAASTTVTASLILKVRFPDLLEAYVASTQDVNSPFFHRFLSVQAFDLIFSPSQRDIATITHYLAGFGITVTDVYADRLLIKATGAADAFDKAFAVDLHDFMKNGRRFHRPRHAPRIPLLLRDLLVAVAGPSDEAQFRPHRMNAHAAAAKSPIALPATVLPRSGAIATGQPGSFTVGDLANMYNINPLYAANIDGTGRTIGIATLANFIPQDALDYWSIIGLSVDPNRITQVHVDGGGVLGSAAGSGETSLDVEQSGGVAPGAKIIVYDAPNTSAGFLDLFYKAASDNLVDSLSVSWGSAEEFYFESVVGTDRTPELFALHQAFLESAAQGISLFCSSGDNGAFDINRAFNDPVNNVLSVDVPSADPAITSSGGTTTPIVLNAGPGTPDLVVANEQVWGWDYIQDYLVALFPGQGFENALFPAGGGGGVSTFWPRPYYQANTHGIRKTEAGQSVIFDDGSGAGPQDLLDLPAGFAGRNLPDVSLDADPFSGYLLLSSTDDPNNFISGEGGTSFVAPQLNGISALLEQASGGRIGLWNPMLYRLKKSLGNSAGSPFVDITFGDNWFYNGVQGYEPGAGLGVLNVANLATVVTAEAHHHH
jgi:subtilase family serine protease